jgi:UDP-glucose 4-epimerase
VPSNLRGARALVTGGAGLIGSAIVDQLVGQGVGEVVVFDDFSRGQHANLDWAIANGTVRVITADVRDADALRAAMRGIDIVFHQAALRITHCAEDPKLAMEVLADGTFNVIDAARTAAVRKVVFASSASIYGEADTFPTTERHHAYGNRTLYGAAKLFGEGLLRSFHEMYGLDYVALRYFNVYGPRMDTHGRYTEVLVRWLERIDAGQPPLVFGDGSQRMDVVYVSDVARANLVAAQSDVSDEVFNVASGTEISLLELARTLLAAMQSNVEIEHRPARPVAEIARRLGDTAKAREKLGFTAEVPLREGLERLVAWWRESRVRGRSSTG